MTEEQFNKLKDTVAKVCRKYNVEFISDIEDNGRDNILYLGPVFNNPDQSDGYHWPEYKPLVGAYKFNEYYNYAGIYIHGWKPYYGESRMYARDLVDYDNDHPVKYPRGFKAELEKAMKSVAEEYGLPYDFSKAYRDTVNCNALTWCFSF